MNEQPRILIRPGQAAFARGVYDSIRIDELKRERARLRAEQLEAAQRRLDKLDLELAGLAQIRARELAADLGRHGFDTSQLRPTPLPSEMERQARRRRGRPDVDPLVRALAEDAADRGRLVSVYSPPITIQ